MNQNSIRVITVTLEENQQLNNLIVLCMNSLTASRELFQATNLKELSEREFAMVQVTTVQFAAMEELLRNLIELFQRAEREPEVIQ